MDLSGVIFCDSMGLGVLAHLRNQSREQRAGLTLSGIPPHVERVLTITGLRTAFRVTPFVEEAISTMTPAPAAAVPPPAPPPAAVSSGQADQR